jgi:hypothetical protein
LKDTIEGFFLAPKSYSIIPEEGEEVLVQKGATKSLVSKEWFKEQY